MLTSFHIRGFKSLIDERVDLGAINVFIGANGSGKSNILEAVGVLSAAISGRVDDESLLRRGIRPGLPVLYKSSFKNHRTAPEIFLDAEGVNREQYRVSLNNPLRDPATAWLYKTESFKVGEKDLCTIGVRTHRNKEVGLAFTSLAESAANSSEVLFFKELESYAIFTPNTPTLRGIQPDAIKGAVGLMGGGLAEALSSLWRYPHEASYSREARNLLDWVECASLTHEAADILSPSVQRQRNILRFTDRYMAQERNQLTAFDASEGALYVYFALVLARAKKSPAFFAVDNFDQALNPRLATRLMQYFCRWMLIRQDRPRQALLTIHNPAGLDGLPLNDDRVRLFTVSRNTHGHTKITRIAITPELAALATTNNWPLSQLWTMGHLGGVPNV